MELIDELDHKIASQFAVFDELDTLTLPDEDIGHFVRSFGKVYDKMDKSYT